MEWSRSTDCDYLAQIFISARSEGVQGVEAPHYYEHSLMENQQVLNRIFMIAERMIVFDGLDDVFEHIVKTAVSLTHAEGATIRVFDIESGTLKIAKGYGISDEFLSQPAIRVGEGITGTVVQTGKSFSTTDVRVEAACKHSDMAELEGIRAMLCVPMNTRTSTIGCITVYRKDNIAFADHDLLLLSIFASEAVEAIEKAKLISELQRQATLDPLTGLYNKRAFIEKLHIEVARNERHHHSLALMFIDLDNFKSFNDQHGHLMGDKMLHDFTHLLQQHCRKMDVIGRFGGDEFLIIAPQTDREGAFGLAEKIRLALAAHEFISSNIATTFHTSCSIGIALMPDQAKNTDELLARADQALYVSKRAGKGQATIWSEQF